MIAAPRSLLFVPANQPRRFAKADGSGADIVILDLEDTVPVKEKPAARQAVQEALAARHRTPIYVRVNPLESEHCYADMMAVMRPGLDGIVLPKVGSAGEVQTIDWLIRQLEADRELEGGHVDLLPIVETAQAVSNLDAIAGASSRVRRLTFGAGDLTRELGMQLTPDEIAIADVRARLVLASGLAQLEPPIDTVYIAVRDIEGAGVAARRARVFGCHGKLCIHPDQVPVVNQVFTPSAEEIAHAERVAEAFKKAEDAGIASIEVDGGFVDYPIVQQAWRTLDLAKRLKARTTAAH
jgi:citrate lyase subunit beta/citryl-CoA lyase